jgi:hypothetical protein
MTSDEAFSQQLRDIALASRTNGQMEMRIVVMRWLERQGLRRTAKAIGALDVDMWLTPEEIAQRNKMP